MRQKKLKSKPKTPKRPKSKRGLKLKEGQYFAVFVPRKKESGRI